MRYIPHTKQDIERMLRIIGAESVDALFEVIPEELRPSRELELPGPLSEVELFDHLQALGAPNRPQGRDTGVLAFAGAGCHPHAVPATVDALAARSEFYTAYTPYQPELSQGTLLSIFEFQTMVCELLGLEVANASMYDGASAAAEAVLMARRLTRRRKVLVASSLHPEYVATCETYISGMEDPAQAVGRVPWTAAGGLDSAALAELLDQDTAALLVQTPNVFGVLEQLQPLCDMAHAAGALLVVVTTEPLALALARTPGSCGADIAVAEGLGLAAPPNLGGPGVGLLAVRGKKAMRAMPGRIVGQTRDADGKVGYVLTLSTREQHIRREKATSNICTNHGLMALRMTIHLALLGRTGFQRLAQINLAKAAFAHEQLCKLDGLTPAFSGPFFNEFAVKVAGGDAQAVVARAVESGVVPGVALGRFFPELRDTLLIAVNETHTRDDIMRLAQTLETAA